MENKPTHIALYTLIGRFERVKQALTIHFAGMTKELMESGIENSVERLAIRLKDDSEIELNINAGPDFIAQHITGMYNFFSRVECENQKLRQSVLNQIGAFNCVVGGSFTQDSNEDSANYIIKALFAAAKDLNALVLLPDMRLFSAEGRLVFSARGESDFDEYIPVGNADFIDSRAEESPGDAARRERSITILEVKGIPYLSRLRAAALESEAALPSPEEIARRLFAMFGVCVYCEIRSGGQVAVFRHWHERYGAVPDLVGSDVWELELRGKEPVKDNAGAAALASEQFAFCYDIVMQAGEGFDSIRGLANSLRGSSSLYFWWD
jgi:hypothetical protein